MTPFLASLAVVALAELGDKSQILILAFTTRFRPLVVAAGITAAAAVMQLLAVAAGELASLAIPLRPLQVLAGLSFIIYGLWTIRGGHQPADREVAGRYGAFFTVALAFFLAELGDKTQLATVSLATQYGAPVWVWLGATAGILAANGLAIVAGSTVLRKLPYGVIQWAAAAVFFFFGAAALIMAFR